jgi:hypothetical protein
MEKRSGTEIIHEHTIISGMCMGVGQGALLSRIVFG